VARLIQIYGLTDPKRLLEVGREAAFEKQAKGWAERVANPDSE
jgi:hypothetical protein